MRMGRKRRADYEKILELRKQGCSYKLIARTLGCGRETAIGVCRRAGLTGKIETTLSLPRPEWGKVLRVERNEGRSDGYRPWLKVKERK